MIHLQTARRPARSEPEIAQDGHELPAAADTRAAAVTGSPGARRHPRRFAAYEVGAQFVLVGGAILLYFLTRGLTEGSHATAARHGHDVLRFERWIGVDWEHGIQNLLVDHHWVVTFFNWIYIWAHWPVIAVALFVLFRHRRADYLILRNAMFVSGAIGLVIFATYPVAPPRLMDIGLVDTVTRYSESYRLLQPPALVNKYAALPSLHVGWDLLVGIVLFRVVRSRWLKAATIVLPVLMASAVVITANHFVVDGVAGAIIALGGLAVSLAWARRRPWGRFARTLGASDLAPVAASGAGARESDRSREWSPVA